MLRPSVCLIAAILIPASSISLVSQSASKPLTVEAIYGHGSLTGGEPDQLTWSPDGKHLSYLDGGQLIDLDPSGGHPHVLVSRAKLAQLAHGDTSEKDRDHRLR